MQRVTPDILCIYDLMHIAKRIKQDIECIQALGKWELFVCSFAPINSWKCLLRSLLVLFSESSFSFDNGISVRRTFLSCSTMFGQILLSIFLAYVLTFAVGENHVAIESNTVSFKCSSKETPIWLEKTKSISMAIGTNKRTAFTNQRFVSF